MLKRGYLAGNRCYLCTHHTDEVIELYSIQLDEVFELISSCHRGLLDIHSLLNGPVCHDGFTRLN